MSHTLIRKPRMHGSPERSPGAIEILESKVVTASSPSLPPHYRMSWQPQHEFSSRHILAGWAGFSIRRRALGVFVFQTARFLTFSPPVCVTLFSQDFPPGASSSDFQRAGLLNFLTSFCCTLFLKIVAFPPLTPIPELQASNL
jgi:hypothetical protein